MLEATNETAIKVKKAKKSGTVKAKKLSSKIKTKVEKKAQIMADVKKAALLQIEKRFDRNNWVSHI